MRVSNVGEYVLLGETLDDAAGEAFDKTAQLLGLGYPGGPALAGLAERGVSGRVTLPRPMLHSGDLDFSFSGLKTAVMLQVKDRALDDMTRADIAAEFQNAIVDVLIAKSLSALEQTGVSELVVAGGVVPTGNCGAACRTQRPRMAPAFSIHRRNFVPITEP